ncbi:NB-ARC domain-containing protein [Nostoc sp. ChiQUE01b]|uniref:NB-ARC domain-containing protein n=1 Tax=Nostoc sp. ChiQUE01b TaxID=3075376 RepID=UPI002AD4F109|nr:NB-ARC domain-containing protein [Nostoc sp. ChiQUE01b]MDZ8263943.1 NB-ARC domain-containing protein [Nostoc sp. ChiQUE01b]
MNSSQVLDVKRVLAVLEEQVFQSTGRYLTEVEKVLIKGVWDSKDYKEMASDSGYNAYYLQQKVAPPLWSMLSVIIGDGVKVTKISLKSILLKLAKSDYRKEEASRLDNDSFVGNIRIYGELPKIKSFYGRKDEINYFKKQITLFKERCIVFTGVGGIGKTLLASRLVEEITFDSLSSIYECIIWKTINHSLSIDELVIDLNKIFQVDIEASENSFIDSISLLSKQLHLHRCLLVIDGFEKLLLADDFGKRLQYEKFLLKLTEGKHESCIIITSQLPLKEFASVTTKLPIRSFKLEGLDVNAGMQILQEKGLTGQECKRLIENYSGNPSSLEALADRINRFFEGNVKTFFRYQTTMIDPQLETMLHQQFGQVGLLSNLQRQIMIYLAEEMSENSTYIQFSKLIDNLKERVDFKLSVFELITAIEVLEQRSLIEIAGKSNKREASYSLQASIKKYILVDPLGLVHKIPDTIQTREVTLWATA